MSGSGRRTDFAPGFEAAGNLLQVSIQNLEISVSSARDVAREQEVDAGNQAGALVFVTDPEQQLFDFPDFAVGVEFGRQKPGVFHHAVGGAQVFRHEHVVIELERRAGARQAIELPALLRLAYAPLGYRIQARHGGV